MVFCLRAARSRTIPTIVGRISSAPTFLAREDIERENAEGNGANGAARALPLATGSSFVDIRGQHELLRRRSVEELHF